MDKYLRPTDSIDCDNTSIKEKAQYLVIDQNSIRDKAKCLFYFVRDEIKYNIYTPSDKPEYYVASRILKEKNGFCIQKAVLLTALSRATGIPARLRIAAIRNHLLTDKLRRLIGGDIFPTHGYAELYIEQRWIKVAPTFDLKMCQKNRFVPVEFDGEHDAIMPACNQDGKRHIEYVEDRGDFDDLPFEEIINWRVEAFGAEFFKRMENEIKSGKKQA